MNPIHLPAVLRAAALAAAITLTASPAARAADATAAVQITGLSFATSAGIQLSWLPASRFVGLYAESREAGGLGGNSLQAPAPSAWADTGVQTATAHAAAAATTTAGALAGVQAAADRALIDPLAQPHTGAAWVLQSGEFTLSGAGHVTVVLDYTLAASAPTTDGSDTWAYAALTASLGNWGSGQSQLRSVEQWSFDQAGPQAGRFTFELDVDGPQQTGAFDLRLNANASAVAAVPEPAHWLLMLAGLAAVGWRQQRLARRAATTSATV